MARSVDIVFNGRDNVSKAATQVSQSLGRVQRSMSSLAKSAIGFAAGFLAVGKSISFISDGFTEFSEKEDISRKLGITLTNLGTRTEVTRNKVEALAASIHRTTVFEDDAAIAASNLLLGVRGLSEQGFARALKISTDLAAQMGSELPEAADLLARAMSKPETAARLLRSAGVLLTTAEQEQIKAFVAAGDAAGAYAKIMESVADRVKGSAAKMADTTSGQIKRLERDWADLKENMAGRIAGTGIVGDIAEVVAPETRTNRIQMLERQIKELKEGRLLAGAMALVGVMPGIGGSREELARLRGEEAAEFDAAIVASRNKRRDARREWLRNSFASKKKQQEQEIEDEKRFFLQPDPIGKQLEFRAKYMFERLGGMMARATLPFVVREKIEEEKKKKPDPPIGQLDAVESRFLTRGSGAVTPFIVEQRKANKLSKEQLKELQDFSVLLKRIITKGGLVAAKFN